MRLREASYGYVVFYFTLFISLTNALPYSLFSVLLKLSLTLSLLVTLYRPLCLAYVYLLLFVSAFYSSYASLPSILFAHHLLVSLPLNNSTTLTLFQLQPSSASPYLNLAACNAYTLVSLSLFFLPVTSILTLAPLPFP